ncbi:hypothetical protein D3C80_1514400 [compost metagenome]
MAGDEDALAHAFVHQLGQAHGAGLLVGVETGPGRLGVFHVLEKRHADAAGRAHAHAQVGGKPGGQVLLLADQSFAFVEHAAEKALHRHAKQFFLGRRDVVEPPARAMQARGQLAHRQAADALDKQQADEFIQEFVGCERFSHGGFS